MFGILFPWLSNGLFVDISGPTDLHPNFHRRCQAEACVSISVVRTPWRFSTQAQPFWKGNKWPGFFEDPTQQGDSVTDRCFKLDFMFFFLWTFGKRIPLAAAWPKMPQAVCIESLGKARNRYVSKLGAHFTQTIHRNGPLTSLDFHVPTHFSTLAYPSLLPSAASVISYHGQSRTIHVWAKTNLYI